MPVHRVTNPSARVLRKDAVEIWNAGVRAVDSRTLVSNAIALDAAGNLTIAEHVFPAGSWNRLLVIGAGKAGAGMAAGVIDAFAGHWDGLLEAGRVDGWLNVPDDCVRELPGIHLHGARPAGRNEPTEAGVHGTREMLQRIQALDANDICLCLISGGGSALMPMPIEHVTLQDKQLLTRHLSAAGANIEELNTVRKQLSQVKGGGLARACHTSHLATLIISDVIGDPLDVIASGPTIADSSTPADALRIMKKFHAESSGASPAVWRTLEHLDQSSAKPAATGSAARVKFDAVIGNNAVAVAAAADQARRLGYTTRAEPATALEGDASDLGRRLADQALRMRMGDEPCHCLISGGEPTVTLAPAEIRGKGGRNQQLAAAAWARLIEADQSTPGPNDGGPRGPCDGVVVLSGGTDGEDGPTDAAGAWISGELIADSREDIDDAIARSDTYTLFHGLGNLLTTGPTHTNVCDLRIILTSANSHDHRGNG